MSIRDARDADSRVEDGRHSTGIKVLDEDLLRGVPKGSTIAILGDPKGMAHLIPSYLPLTGRETQYVATTQTSENIKQRLHHIQAYEDSLPENLTVEDTISGTESAQNDLTKYVNRIGEEHNFVVDTMSQLRDNDDLVKLVRNIQTETRRNDGLTYLYFASESIDDLTRTEREALHIVDGVWKTELGLSGDTIETRLYVYRQNGVQPPEERIKLNVGETLTIDTTRDIA